mgnify:CR=1 FL=1|jgi:hypothetical protein
MTKSNQIVYTYTERKQSTTNLIEYGAIGITFLLAFFTLKKFLILVLGVKSIGVIGTIIIGMISAYAGNKVGQHTVQYIDGKTFYFFKDRLVIVTRDGEFTETFYKDTVTNALAKLKGKEHIVSQQSEIHNTTPTVEVEIIMPNK